MTIHKVEEEEVDEDDELRDWITVNQQRQIRDKAIDNAWNRLQPYEKAQYNRRNQMTSEWHSVSEEALFDDNNFEEKYGEEAYHEVVIRCERQKLLNKRARVDRLQL